MLEDDVQRLISSIESLPHRPSDEFVARTRQRISDEVQTIRVAEINSVDTVDDLGALDSAIVDVAERVDSVDGAGRAPSRIGLVISLAAACLAGIVAIQAIRTNDRLGMIEAADNASTGEGRPIDITGLPSNSDAAMAFAVVDDAYAAHTAGDVEAWFAARFAGTEFDSEIEREAERGRLRANLALGEEIEVSGCESHGLGDWPLILDSGELASGYRFRCQTVTADAILRAAGVGIPQLIDWVVFEGQIVGVRIVDEDLSDLMLFDLEFREWLGDNRPEGLSYLDNGTNPDELLGFATEFLAESENYPATTDGP